MADGVYTDNDLAKLTDCISDNNEGLFYNKASGKLYKITELATSREKGDRLASKSITFQGKQRQSTHVIFYLVTGRFPELGVFIDHKNRDSSNNKWENLREATPAQNMYNKGDPGKWINTDLPRGVALVGNRYRVVVNNILIGSYESKEEATTIAIAERKKLHGEFFYQPSIRRV